MKRLLLATILVFCSLFIIAQNIAGYNTVYDMKYYKAYYSKTIQTSSFVIYKLYKGGGSVSRVNMSFRAYKKLPHYNYVKSGYDRGHLVPAEDFANDVNKLKQTFYYINCIPQTVKLNRGIWKTYETKVRNISQIDSIIIICGGCDYTKNSCIPQNCFKIVYNLRTHRCIFALMFKNDNSGYAWIDNELKKKLTYTKIMQLYNK